MTSSKRTGSFCGTRTRSAFLACCRRPFLSYSERRRVTKSQLAFSSSRTHPALSHLVERESSGGSWASPQVLQTSSGVRPEICTRPERPGTSTNPPVKPCLSLARVSVLPPDLPQMVFCFPYFSALYCLPSKLPIMLSSELSRVVCCSGCPPPVSWGKGERAFSVIDPGERGGSRQEPW